jgi:competence protein ComEA
LGANRVRTTIIVGVVAAVVAASSTALAIAFLDARSAPPIVISDPPSSIVVSVEGAVSRPGVYTLPSGSRVNDALVAAGGVRTDADLTTLNLAARLRDGQRLIVPSVSAALADGLTAPGASPVPSQAPQEAPSGRININTATIEELDTLPGIGQAKAQAIVEYRTTHGPFRTVDELVLVDGISPAMLDRLRPLITV